MDYLQALMLAIVEGFSEFLPISSTGHLILASDLLQVPQTEFVKSFEIIIQLGAILAVVVLYWRMLLINREIMKRTIIAFLPTAAVGFTLYKIIKDLLIGNSAVVVLALLIGGILLIIFEKFYQEKSDHTEDISKLSYKNAILIGLAQSISIVPGVSRAAATIIGGLAVGLKRESAVQFSFLLAVPTMLAATGLDLIKSNFAFLEHEYFLLGIGFLGSFIVAILVIKFFLRYIRTHNFIIFGVYRIILALVFWLFFIR